MMKTVETALGLFKEARRDGCGLVRIRRMLTRPREPADVIAPGAFLA
jgi:hypothetical protein